MQVLYKQTEDRPAENKIISLPPLLNNTYLTLSATLHKAYQHNLGLL